MKLLQLLALVFFVAFSGCSTWSRSSQSVAPGYERQATPSQPTESSSFTDPTCCDPNTNEDLKKAWQAFTGDGRYQLARKSSDYPAYVFTWGDLGYASEVNRHHMAAIIEDTSRADNARFGVVIFSAPVGENGAYRTYWLLRDGDFSQGSFFKVSEYLEFHQIGQDGSRETCDIRWNQRSKQYYCRPL
ncbi:MAG TPA: hypothetical protein VFR78_15490 [Pyrinomonadaceae bacterium]|nr:hypothetical protein [Pyrinomonadaceae bacterium]